MIEFSGMAPLACKRVALLCQLLLGAIRELFAIRKQLCIYSVLVGVLPKGKGDGVLLQIVISQYCRRATITPRLRSRVRLSHNSSCRAVSPIFRLPLQIARPFPNMENFKAWMLTIFRLETCQCSTCIAFFSTVRYSS